MRTLKVFAVAALAAVAISGLVAASALAEAFHSESAGTTWTGSQVTKNEFKTNVGTLKCSVVTLSGSMASTETVMFTVHPSYSGCTLAGLAVTVSTTSCNYTFTEPTRGFTIFWRHWIAHNECSGSSTEIGDSLGLNCKIDVPSQIFGGLMKGESLGTGSGREIEATWELTEIAYSYTASCPSVSSAGSASNGTRSGTIRFKGSSGIWVE
ncbi:MAG TPA: hypothetical protein VGI73_08170 [Solirubrobacterales bacterium]|jgi:hypothetical protein